MSQRYCRNCGAELEAGDRFCSECGHRTDTTSEAVDQHDTDSREADRSQEDRETEGNGWGSSSATGAGNQYDQSAQGGHGQGSQPDTSMAAITHVLALFTWLIGPLIIYMVTDDPFVKENAANATNWQIMFTVYMLLSVVLIILLVGIVFLILLPLLDIAFIIIATLKASEGEAWTYPLTPKIL